MKALKVAAIAASAYVALVVGFESMLGFFQPGGRLENRFRAVAPGSGVWRLSAFGGGFLGAHLADVNEGLGSYFGVDAGALVLELEGDDHDLGLQPGDVIVEIGGRDVEDAADAYRILGSYEEGERLRVVVMRQRSRTTLEGTVD